MNPASSAFSVRWDIFLLTLGMCLVTYIPRALPALFGGRLRLQPWAQRFLNLIPCAALTALIFPGILNTDPARPWIGIAGGIAAALLAWRRCPVLVCVLTAAVVGFASISLCRLIIRKFGLKIFAFNTGALGLILIARQLLAG